MAKKDNDNFDFETEGKAKAGLNLDFLKNLTKQQKGIILIAAVAAVLVIAIIVTCVIIGAGNEQNDNDNNNSNVNNNGLPTDITGFIISNLPIKTVYYVGAEPDYTGMSLYITSDGENSLTINYMEQSDLFTVTGFDSSTPVENQTITVEYKGFTDTFTIKVIEVPAAAPTLVAIHLDPNNMPVDTCKLGYAPDIRGAKLICEYSDGTTKVVDLAYEHLNDFEEDLMAAQVGDIVTIPVVYDEDGYVAETTFTVTITE